MQQNFGQKKRPDAQITFFIKYRRNNYLTPVNLIGTAGSGRSEVVLSAHWLITEWILIKCNLTFWSRRRDQMAKFSLRMYTSRLLPMGVQDFMGKSEYVRSSDFRRTEANFRRKNAQNVH